MEDTLRVYGKLGKHELLYCLNPCFNGRYSQRGLLNTNLGTKRVVLILVLMEDTLRDANTVENVKKVVLILVLMEDTLRVMLESIIISLLIRVLILVLMEDTLRELA